MTADGVNAPAAPGDLAGLADVIDVLARIHDREVDAAFIGGWRANGLSQWIGDVLGSAMAKEGVSALEGALDALPDPLTGIAHDDLASDYADIYLTHAYRISPNGSVWLTEEGLERQGPMFDTRSWYRRYGVEVPDWRKRPDDNIVHQLQFLAHLLRTGDPEALADAARFLDGGLLAWLPEFAARIGARARTPFYRAFARLTHAAVDEVRDRLEQGTGLARQVAALPQPSCAATAAPDEIRYMPGQAESW